MKLNNAKIKDDAFAGFSKVLPGAEAGELVEEISQGHKEVLPGDAVVIPVLAGDAVSVAEYAGFVPAGWTNPVINAAEPGFVVIKNAKAELKTSKEKILQLIIRKE